MREFRALNLMFGGPLFVFFMTMEFQSRLPAVYCVAMFIVHAVSPTHLWLYCRLCGATYCTLLSLEAHNQGAEKLVSLTVATCGLVLQLALGPSGRLWLSQHAHLATLDAPLQTLQPADLLAAIPHGEAPGVALPQPPEQLAHPDSEHSGSVAQWSTSSPLLHGNDSWTWHSMSSRYASDDPGSVAPSDASRVANGDVKSTEEEKAILADVDPGGGASCSRRTRSPARARGSFAGARAPGAWW